MGIEKTMGDLKVKEFSRPKKGRRKQKKSLPVQTLYETCKQVFANCGPGIVPSASDVQRLKSVLDSMTELDVGLRPNMPFFRAEDNERLPPITYLHLYDCNKFSIGIFCLPPSGVIPLHNHPGMTVLSKLLFGTMHIKSYDWVDNVHHETDSDVNPLGADEVHSVGKQMTSKKEFNPAGVRLAKLKVNSNFTAPNTSILYPADGGNMHCFTALTPCAVLDVLGPPYSDPEGRHCTYYLDIPYAKFSVGGVAIPEEEEVHAWLQEREKPQDLAVVGAPYSGPKIVEK